MSEYIFVVSTAGVVMRTKIDEEVLRNDEGDALMAVLVDTISEVIKVHDDIDVDVDDVGFIGFISDDDGIKPLDLSQAMMVARNQERGLLG